MVDGAIRHGADMAIEANYADTHGQSEIGFGITRLLGFDLLPRIKRINKVKLYRPAVGEPDLWPGLAPALKADKGAIIMVAQICFEVRGVTRCGSI